MDSSYAGSSVICASVYPLGASSSQTIFSALILLSNWHQHFRFLQGAEGASFSKQAPQRSHYKTDDELSQTA